MDKNVLDLCDAGDLIEVERCLDEGFCPNFQNCEGETLLQIAAANGFSNLVSLLLKRGASIDLPNNYGWTPLMHASRYGHTSTVSLLLKMKAKVNISNKLGISAMVAAACSGNLSTVKLLVEAGAILDHVSAGNETSQCDLSPIMAASLYGHDPVLQYLINNGVEIEHSSAIIGLTPLMLAACGGHKHVISILVENGADLNKKDLCGRTALDISHAFNQLETKAYLESLMASKSEGSLQKTDDIFEAIKNGDVSKVKLILENDQDSVRSVEPGVGKTPLILASMLGHYDIVHLLISFGANLDAQDTENGWTALMHAIFCSHRDVVRMLLEMGADTDACASNGYTALDLAQHNDSTDPGIIEMLTSRLVTCDLKSSFMQLPDGSNRGRLSSSDRLPSKRSLSQTRVKEWIGGVAQHLQNKMLTRRSAKFSENVPSVDITLTDESANEVFLEQTLPPKECDKERTNEPAMLPPDLYLASALKEHKVEAIKPPFPPMFTGHASSSKDIQKKSPNNKSSKPRVKSLRVPNLLRHHSKKKPFFNSSGDEIEKTLVPKERDLSNENKISTILPEHEISLCSSSEVNQETIKLEAAFANFKKPCPGDLTVLLNKESLQKYAETFRNQEVDMETFQHLTEADLSEIGIESTESQKKLMEVIKKFQISE